MSLAVPANERGIIRIFALSMGDAEAAPLRAHPDASTTERAEQLGALLGTRIENAASIEVFPVADLEDLGLAGYMIEGNGVDPDQVAPDLSRLAAIEGWVMVVYSNALGRQPTILKPAPSLTLIGTYSEPRTNWTSANALTSRAATESPVPPKKAPSDAAMMGRVATLVLLGLFIFTAAFVWIAS